MHSALPKRQEPSRPDPSLRLIAASASDRDHLRKPISVGARTPLGAPDLTTRNKDPTRSKGHRYSEQGRYYLYYHLLSVLA